MALVRATADATASLPHMLPHNPLLHNLDLREQERGIRSPDTVITGLWSKLQQRLRFLTSYNLPSHLPRRSVSVSHSWEQPSHEDTKAKMSMSPSSLVPAIPRAVIHKKRPQVKPIIGSSKLLASHSSRSPQQSTQDWTPLGEASIGLIRWLDQLPRRWREPINVPMFKRYTLYLINLHLDFFGL